MAAELRAGRLSASELLAAVLAGSRPLAADLSNLGLTRGIDNAEVIATVHVRKAPMIPASTGLRLEAGPPRRDRGPISTARVEEQHS